MPNRPNQSICRETLSILYNRNTLRDSSSWSSPPLMLLRDIHSKLITQYDSKEVCAPSQSQINVGASGGLSSQDGVSQRQKDAFLSIPQLNRLFLDSFVWDETSASNADVTVITSQHRVTLQILSHCQSFRDLKLLFVHSCHTEQISLSSQQHMVATVDSVRTLSFGRRWQSWSLRKRIPTRVSSQGSSR